MGRRKALVLTLVIGIIGILVFWLAKPREEVKTLNVAKAKTEVLSGAHSTVDGNPKFEPLKYFIVGVLENNVDIFLSGFYPQTISKDLFKSKEQDKAKVSQDLMNDISRNGTIVKVKYKENKGYFNSETNSLTLMLIYEDHSRAEVNLEVLPLTNGSNIYTIKTSSKEIIEQTKNHTN